MFAPFTGRKFKDGTKSNIWPNRAQTQISRRTRNELSFMLSFLLGHCPRSLCLVTFLPLCLHLHFSSHVYHCACNGSRLHSSRSFNNLLPCIILQPLLFQHPTSTPVGASLVLACIALKVLIVSCLVLPCNFSCFNILHLCL
jgi:hypothetical protein